MYRCVLKLTVCSHHCSNCRRRTWIIIISATQVASAVDAPPPVPPSSRRKISLCVSTPHSPAVLILPTWEILVDKMSLGLIHVGALSPPLPRNVKISSDPDVLPVRFGGGFLRGRISNRPCTCPCGWCSKPTRPAPRPSIASRPFGCNCIRQCQALMEIVLESMNSSKTSITY